MSLADSAFRRDKQLVTPSVSGTSSIGVTHATTIDCGCRPGVWCWTKPGHPAFALGWRRWWSNSRGGSLAS